jgi:hypothetical protein
MLVAFRLAGLSALQAYCAGVCVGAQKSPCGNGRKDGSAIIGLISGARRRWRREGSLIAQVAILPAVICTSLPVMLRSSTLDRCASCQLSRPSGDAKRVGEHDALALVGHLLFPPSPTVLCSARRG